MLVTFGDAVIRIRCESFSTLGMDGLVVQRVFCTRNCLGFEAFKIIGPNL
jgi:hypothetical protein